MDERLREGPGEINAGLPRPEDVRAALDVVRPGLLADGGNVELLCVDDDGTVRLLLQGACQRCPAQEMTLRQVVEPLLRERLPGVSGVVAVED
jgi:Fe-S cluster biogenesis protein NfuA